MTTCSEYAAMKSQAEADLLVAQAEVDVAQASVEVCEAAVTVAMNELATANVVKSEKEYDVSLLEATIMGINMMMSMQNC